MKGSITLPLTPGSSPGEFNTITTLRTSSNGNIAVLDANGLQIFSTNGTLLSHDFSAFFTSAGETFIYPRDSHFVVLKRPVSLSDTITSLEYDAAGVFIHGDTLSVMAGNLPMPIDNGPLSLVFPDNEYLNFRQGHIIMQFNGERLTGLGQLSSFYENYEHPFIGISSVGTLYGLYSNSIYKIVKHYSQGLLELEKAPLSLRERGERGVS
ncbi:MAG: hypothetical protein V1913_02740 [Fibrobacterota bacterium]